MMTWKLIGPAIGACFVVVGVLLVSDVQGQVNYGAVASGNWDNAATWTPGGGPPLATDNALIGTTSPVGSAPVATVTLTGDEEINNLFLGANVGTVGTLDLDGNTLTANLISIGSGGGTGVIVQNGGNIDTNLLQVMAGNSFVFGTLDQSNDLLVQSRAK
jgi:hypothetical protein